MSLQEGDETMDSIAGELKADQEEEASSAEKGTMDSIAGELKADQEKEVSSAEKGTMDSITAELKADQVKGASAAENGVLARITVPLKADQEKNGLVVFTQQEKNAGESSEIFSYIILGIAVIFGLFVIYLFLKWEGSF
ncbi:MAG: hypothetical protein KAS99_06380 [Candidatus Omnitrophica bacterium]|nr:hypothetical protein [Candidatus Omnitrophota bacterium]